MIPKIAALLIVMGIGCRFADPKGICANGVCSILSKLFDIVLNKVALTDVVPSSIVKIYFN
mgnify:CR=1 FL=1